MFCNVAGHEGFTFAITSEGQRLLVKYLLSRSKLFYYFLNLDRQFHFYIRYSLSGVEIII